MKLLRGLYTFYGVIVFTVLFAFFFLLFLIPITFRNQYRLVGVLNRWWARFMFFLIAIPYHLEYRSKIDLKKQYIFTPNHFSYLDIAALGLNHHNTIFVGKNDMENIPVFGYMYRKLHITVDRAKLKSRYSSMIKTFQALDDGKSLVIFPEGGIITEHDPVMGKFKDGAFRAAIEKQIPIVPVTIPYNWIILPPNEFLLRWKMLKVIFHEPVETKGLTLADLEPLKEKVKTIIEVELQKHLSK